MRAFVFTDASLERQAGRFVWLEINSEKKANAPVREQFPFRALPTYMVIDPTDESVLLSWVGGATVEQLHAMLDGVADDFAVSPGGCGKGHKEFVDVGIGGPHVRFTARVS